MADLVVAAVAAATTSILLGVAEAVDLPQSAGSLNSASSTSRPSAPKHVDVSGNGSLTDGGQYTISWRDDPAMLFGGIYLVEVRASQALGLGSAAVSTVQGKSRNGIGLRFGRARCYLLLH